MQQVITTLTLIMTSLVFIALEEFGIVILPDKDINIEGITGEKAYVNSVIDGDTIRVVIDDKEKTVRLIGIDTPETNHPNKPVQCFGQEAKKKLTSLLDSKQILLEKDISETDRYGRLLRYVYLPTGEFVNQVMVEEGYAFSQAFPPDIKYHELLENAETSAQSSKSGLWNESTCNGTVD